MKILSKWLLAYVSTQIEATPTTPSVAPVLSGTTETDVNAAVAWSILHPKKRVQVRKITSHSPGTNIPLNMELSDGQYYIDSMLTKECLERYDLARTELDTHLPPITSLRGAIIIVQSARLRLLKPHRCRQLFSIGLAIDDFTFIGNHGTEPVDQTYPVAEAQQVMASISHLMYRLGVFNGHRSMPTVGPSRNVSANMQHSVPAREFDPSVDPTFLGQMELDIMLDDD
ncbi:hypothetical protein SpCBS45565_g02998 [Spizellomyces sp. 'palustris']|nr:hypothetical protein SpCBS45565_g02998 [Spizellomyces sp. 'palustris']